MTQIGLIMGRANCVWDDLEQAQNIRPDEVSYVNIAVNVIGCDWPIVHHWVSFHPELLVDWIRRRRVNEYSDDYQLWTSTKGRRMTDWERQMKIRMVDCEGGSSGMIAVKVALELGLEKIMLAGIPMENEAGQYDTGKAWDEADMHRKAWEKLDPGVKKRIRSFSGWTRKQFGAPTWAWMVG